MKNKKEQNVVMEIIPRITAVTSLSITGTSG